VGGGPALGQSLPGSRPQARASSWVRKQLADGEPPPPPSLARNRRANRPAQRPPAPLSANLSRQLDVVVHLLDQGLDGIEAAFASEAFQEFDF